MPNADSKEPNAWVITFQRDSQTPLTISSTQVTRIAYQLYEMYSFYIIITHSIL